MKTNSLDFDAQALREKILDLAMRGKLVPQDPNDEPASVLLDKIKAEKAELIEEKKIKKKFLTVFLVCFLQISLVSLTQMSPKYLYSFCWLE